jgi:plastocyanin
MKSKPVSARFCACLAGGLLLLGLVPAAQAEEHVVSQKNKAFSTKKLKIKVGDSIKFVNDDGFAHNVFSLSTAKSFDTGSFGSGQARSVSFDKPGKVEVECAVHPDMRLDVEVAP